MGSYFFNVISLTCDKTIFGSPLQKRFRSKNEAYVHAITSLVEKGSYLFQCRCREGGYLQARSLGFLLARKLGTLARNFFQGMSF